MIQATPDSDNEVLLAEIRAGLSRPRKELPSKLFYDERGSELFEEITRLPEYYLTRAELALLKMHIPRWTAEQQPRSLIELGAGSAAKTRIILDAMTSQGRSAYVPVDISADFLARTAAELRREYSDLEVIPVAVDFTRALALPPSLSRPALLTFLGSTIGNFTDVEAMSILRRLRSNMRSEDRFLLGVDLRKNVDVLEAAYNDERGVTANFNLNVLRVMNDRFESDFDLEHFRHRAIYNKREHRIEMHLVSTRSQIVRIPRVGEFALSQGETIRTEISCKYDRPTIDRMFARVDLELVEWRTDQNEQFGLALGAPGENSTTSEEENNVES